MTKYLKVLSNSKNLSIINDDWIEIPNDEGRIYTLEDRVIIRQIFDGWIRNEQKNILTVYNTNDNNKKTKENKAKSKWKVKSKYSKYNTKFNDKKRAVHFSTKIYQLLITYTMFPITNIQYKLISQSLLPNINELDNKSTKNDKDNLITYKLGLVSIILDPKHDSKLEKELQNELNSEYYYNLSPWKLQTIQELYVYGELISTKISFLTDIIEYISNNNFNKKLFIACIECILFNLTSNFKRNRKSKQDSILKNKTKKTKDMLNEDQMLELLDLYNDPEWPHLQYYYELLLRFTYINITNELKEYIGTYIINNKVLNFIMVLIKNANKDELDYLKIIIHRFYGRWMILRDPIKNAMFNYVFEFIYNINSKLYINLEDDIGHLNENLNLMNDGNVVGSFCEIFNAIISGLSVPVKNEHIKSFLINILIPLHKLPYKYFNRYFMELAECCTTFVGKNPTKFGTMLLNSLIKYWPYRNVPKQMLFLQLLFNILDLICQSNFDSSYEMQIELQKTLYLVIDKILISSLVDLQTEINERSITIWASLCHDTLLYKINTMNLNTILIHLNQALFININTHWHSKTKKLSLELFQMFSENEHFSQMFLSAPPPPMYLDLMQQQYMQQQQMQDPQPPQQQPITQPQQQGTPKTNINKRNAKTSTPQNAAQIELDPKSVTLSPMMITPTLVSPKVAVMDTIQLNNQIDKQLIKQGSVKNIHNNNDNNKKKGKKVGINEPNAKYSHSKYSGIKGTVASAKSMFENKQRRKRSLYGYKTKKKNAKNTASSKIKNLASKFQSNKPESTPPPTTKLENIKSKQINDNVVHKNNDDYKSDYMASPIPAPNKNINETKNKIKKVKQKKKDKNKGWKNKAKPNNNNDNNNSNNASSSNKKDKKKKKISMGNLAFLRNNSQTLKEHEQKMKQNNKRNSKFNKINETNSTKKSKNRKDGNGKRIKKKQKVIMFDNQNESTKSPRTPRSPRSPRTPSPSPGINIRKPRTPTRPKTPTTPTRTQKSYTIGHHSDTNKPPIVRKQKSAGDERKNNTSNTIIHESSNFESNPWMKLSHKKKTKHVSSISTTKKWSKINTQIAKNDNTSEVQSPSVVKKHTALTKELKKDVVKAPAQSKIIVNKSDNIFGTANISGSKNPWKNNVNNVKVKDTKKIVKGINKANVKSPIESGTVNSPSLTSSNVIPGLAIASNPLIASDIKKPKNNDNQNIIGTIEIKNNMEMNSTKDKIRKNSKGSRKNSRGTTSPRKYSGKGSRSQSNSQNSSDGSEISHIKSNSNSSNISTNSSNISNPGYRKHSNSNNNNNNNNENMDDDEIENQAIKKRIKRNSVGELAERFNKFQQKNKKNNGNIKYNSKNKNKKH